MQQMQVVTSVKSVESLKSMKSVTILKLCGIRHARLAKIARLTWGHDGASCEQADTSYTLVRARSARGIHARGIFLGKSLSEVADGGSLDFIGKSYIKISRTTFITFHYTTEVLNLRPY